MKRNALSIAKELYIFAIGNPDGFTEKGWVRIINKAQSLCPDLGKDNNRPLHAVFMLHAWNYLYLAQSTPYQPLNKTAAEGVFKGLDDFLAICENDQVSVAQKKAAGNRLYMSLSKEQRVFVMPYLKTIGAKWHLNASKAA